MMKSTCRWIAALAGALMLAGCGGGNAGADADSQPLPTSASATLGRAGGSLQSAGLQGGSLTLTLPADALAVPTGITLRGLPPGSDVIDRFAVAPGGRLLLEQAQLRYSAPQALPERAVLRWRTGGSSVPLPTQRQGNTLIAQTSYLGYPSVATAQALRISLRPLADAPPEGELEVAVLDCGSDSARLVFLIRMAALAGDEVEVMQLADELQAMFAVCQAQATGQILQEACDAYASAHLLAQTTAVDSYGQLRAVVTPLMATWANAQVVGAGCDTPAPEALLAEKFAQFNDFLRAEYARPSFAEVEYTTARLELRRFYNYLAICDDLGIEATCQLMRTTLFPEFFDRLREGVYRECRASGDTLPLATMYVEDLAFQLRGQGLRDPGDDTGPYLDLGHFTYADLEADLSHCRSQLTVATFDNALELPELLSSREVVPDIEPGSPPPPITVRVPRDGSITLSGTVRALGCPEGRLSADRLVTRLDGTQIDSRLPDGDRFRLDLPPLDLVVSGVLARTGRDPAMVSRFTIDVLREGDACEGLFTDPFRLYSITVELDDAPPPQRAVGVWSGTIETEFDRLIGIDLGGGNEEITHTTLHTFYTVQIDFGDGLLRDHMQVLTAARNGSYSRTGHPATIFCSDDAASHGSYAVEASNSISGGIELFMTNQDSFPVFYRTDGGVPSCADKRQFPSRYLDLTVVSDVQYPRVAIRDGVGSVVSHRTFDGGSSRCPTTAALCHTIVTHNIQLSGPTSTD